MTRLACPPSSDLLNLQNFHSRAHVGRHVLTSDILVLLLQPTEEIVVIESQQQLSQQRTAAVALVLVRAQDGEYFIREHLEVLLELHKFAWEFFVLQDCLLIHLCQELAQLVRHVNHVLDCLHHLGEIQEALLVQKLHVLVVKAADFLEVR